MYNTIYIDPTLAHRGHSARKVFEDANKTLQNVAAREKNENKALTSVPKAAISPDPQPDERASHADQ